MTHHEFSHIVESLAALSPEQMQKLRDELDSKLAAARQLPAPSTGETAPTRVSKPIWEVADELRKSIPAEEWAKLPVDGASQHDHYIYGTPKRPAR